MNDLENIDSQIMALRRKRIALQNSLPKQHYDFNDIPALKLRADGHRFTTEKKREPKTINKKVKQMKAKITVEKADLLKTLAAVSFVGASVDENKALNPKQAQLVLTVSNYTDLVNLGGFRDTISDADAKAQLDKVAKEKAEKEAAAKAKK